MRRSEYDNLMKHIYTNMRMAKEHERMEHDLYDANYWRGRGTAWKDAMDLIEHYLGREIEGNESEV